MQSTQSREKTVSDKKPSTLSSKEAADLWPMGAVTRRTGLSDHTLRAWERRFGFPKPIRLPSGHRRYSGEQVQQLLLINRALACGHRAGDVVPLPKAHIESMVREGMARPSESQTHMQQSDWVEHILRSALAFDEASIRARMSTDSAILGVRTFLRERVVPLIEAIGSGWARGGLGVRHEHFVSGILEEHLSELRVAFDASTKGRPVVLACLPDEMHSLGLQMVALEISAAGRRNVMLGPHTPIEEIVASVDSLGAVAVGVSVSIFAPVHPTLEMISDLRAQLSTQTKLWVGGGGAKMFDSLPEGTTTIVTLDALADEVGSLLD